MERPFRTRNTERARKLRRESSPAERRLLDQLNNSKLGGWKFTRQFQIGPFFADFVCRAANLVVELDVFSHEMSINADAIRTAKIESMGYRVIRFTNEEVFKELDGVLTSIGLALPGQPTPSPSRLREGSNDGVKTSTPNPSLGREGNTE